MAFAKIQMMKGQIRLETGLHIGYQQCFDNLEILILL